MSLRIEPKNIPKEGYFKVEENVVETDFDFTASEQNEMAKQPEVQAVDTDFSNICSNEVDYEAERREEIHNAVKPLIEENTKRVIQEQHDKFKLEVHEVLNDEVFHRLGKYEKRRRRRAIKEGLGVALKWLFIGAIIFIFVANDQLREEAITIANDVKEIVVGLLNDEEVSSNKLVNDVLNLREDVGNE